MRKAMTRLIVAVRVMRSVAFEPALVNGHWPHVRIPSTRCHKRLPFATAARFLVGASAIDGESNHRERLTVPSVILH